MPEDFGIEGELRPSFGGTCLVEDLVFDSDVFEDLGEQVRVPGVAEVDGSGAGDQLGSRFGFETVP